MQRYPLWLGSCAGLLTYAIMCIWACSQTSDNTAPPPVAKPAIPVAIANQQSAVDSFAQINGKDPVNLSQVNALLAQNKKLESQYESADAAAKAADKKLAEDAQIFIDNEWAFWIDLAAAAIALVGIGIVAIIVVESGFTALLAWGLVEKIAAGCATFSALLFTIAHYIACFKYVPLMIALATAGVITFVYLSHHGAKFLTVLKDILAKGVVEEQHLLNPIVAWVVGKLHKAPVASPNTAPAPSAAPVKPSAVSTPPGST